MEGVLRLDQMLSLLASVRGEEATHLARLWVSERAEGSCREPHGGSNRGGSSESCRDNDLCLHLKLQREKPAGGRGIKAATPSPHSIGGLLSDQRFLSYLPGVLYGDKANETFIHD